MCQAELFLRKGIDKISYEFWSFEEEEVGRNWCITKAFVPTSKSLIGAFFFVLIAEEPTISFETGPGYCCELC